MHLNELLNSNAHRHRVPITEITVFMSNGEEKTLQIDEINDITPTYILDELVNQNIILPTNRGNVTLYLKRQMPVLNDPDRQGGENAGTPLTSDDRLSMYDVEEGIYLLYNESPLQGLSPTSSYNTALSRSLSSDQSLEETVDTTDDTGYNQLLGISNKFLTDSTVVEEVEEVKGVVYEETLVNLYALLDDGTFGFLRQLTAEQHASLLGRAAVRRAEATGFITIPPPPPPPPPAPAETQPAQAPAAFLAEGHASAAPIPLPNSAEMQGWDDHGDSAAAAPAEETSTPAPILRSEASLEASLEAANKERDTNQSDLPNPSGGGGSILSVKKSKNQTKRKSKRKYKNKSKKRKYKKKRVKRTNRK